MSEGNLEIKLPTYGQSQQQWREQSDQRKSQKRKGQQKEEQGARKGRKSGNIVLFNVLGLPRIEK